MRAPGFWRKRGVISALLSPLQPVTGMLTARRVAQPGFAPGIPVICAGNAGVGGAGKTVLVLDLLTRHRGRPFALTRGYRGRLRGPVLVDAAMHLAEDVGDEALLLARVAPTVLARDRAAGARLALAEGATAIIMDDGLQNAQLVKNVSFLVIDGGAGFGNFRLLPAGPLRESVATAAARCQAAVIIGPDLTNAAAALPAGLPVLHAVLKPFCTTPLAGRPMLAFAGIGRPEKFFDSVRSLGGRIVLTRKFADHHIYTPRDAEALLAAAERHAADLVTTEKDFVKLPAELRERTLVVTIRLDWEDEAALRRIAP